jgi:hypothetical protein
MEIPMPQLYNPFMRPQHCARFATRRAFATGEVFHVVETGAAIAPLNVIDDQTLFDLGDRIDVEDLVFTADPFCDAVA